MTRRFWLRLPAPFLALVAGLTGVAAFAVFAAAVAGMAAGVTAVAAPSGGGQVALRRVFAGQALNRPVHLAAPPDGSRRVAVVEQQGRIFWFRLGVEKAQGTLLDIRDRVSTAGNEEGLLSIAFHPGFAANGFFFVYYSAAGPRRSVVARFRVLEGRAAPAGEHAVLEVPQPFSNHNGGQLAFGPDGYLYVALGDGGSAGDPYGNGQNRDTLLGAILRVDVDQPRGYAIPPDNPFARGGGRPEIWAYGLRNPWRFSFDRATGELYAGDVGQNRIEEVNRILKGGNYGWNVKEGSQCFRPPAGCATAGLIGPIAEYGRDEGISITGGVVYRGAALPALRGRYLFGDFGSGTIWSIPTGGNHLRKPEPLLATGVAIASFGEDAAGEVYLLDWSGKIYRLAAPP